MLFDVLHEKVANVLQRTDAVAQVVADNHVRLRDEAMPVALLRQLALSASGPSGHLGTFPL